MRGRRSFLEKVGLGAGAVLLAPIARRLVGEARGAAAARKRFVVFLVGSGVHPDYNFTPPEFRRPGDEVHAWPVPDGAPGFTWPAMLRSLEPFRDRMLLVDGLANQPTRGGHLHSAGYAALSCFAATRGDNDLGGSPGGATFDQYLAARLGADTYRRSVLYGISQSLDPMQTRMFATGRDRPEPHFQDPGLPFQDLFGALTGGAAAAPDRLLLNAIKDDIGRLRRALAGPERGKLDDYLTAIEEVDRRQALARAASCSVPAGLAPAPGKALDPEDRLEAMHAMGTLALACGLTNVLGISCGAGDSHNYLPRFKRICKGTRFDASGIEGGSIGHAPKSSQAPAMDIIHDFNASLLASTARTLSALKEGDGTALDHTVMLYMSDSADAHHSQNRRWPLALIGTAGGKLRCDGRFLRFPAKGAAGSRSMADLFCTLATACGVPTDAFGKGGNEPVKGPLEAILR